MYVVADNEDMGIDLDLRYMRSLNGINTQPDPQDSSHNKCGRRMAPWFAIVVFMPSSKYVEFFGWFTKGYAMPENHISSEQKYNYTTNG